MTKRIEATDRSNTMTTFKKTYGWAWLCDFGLCQWAEPSRDALTSRSKPSPEAIPIRVELIPTLKKYREKTDA